MGSTKTETATVCAGAVMAIMMEADATIQTAWARDGGSSVMEPFRPVQLRRVLTRDKQPHRRRPVASRQDPDALGGGALPVRGTGCFGDLSHEPITVLRSCELHGDGPASPDRDHAAQVEIRPKAALVDASGR